MWLVANLFVALSAETARNCSHDCLHIAPIYSSRLGYICQCSPRADDTRNAGEAALKYYVVQYVYCTCMYVCINIKVRNHGIHPSQSIQPMDR